MFIDDKIVEFINLKRTPLLSCSWTIGKLLEMNKMSFLESTVKLVFINLEFYGPSRS